MVSVLAISKSLSFNSQPTQSTINDKEKVKSFASSQVNLGYATMGAGVLALAGAPLKKGIIKYVAPIPAAAICLMLGANMFSSGQALKKNITNKEQNLDTKA